MRLAGFGGRYANGDPIPSDNAHMHPIYANTSDFIDSDGNLHHEPLRSYSDYRHDYNEDGYDDYGSDGYDEEEEFSDNFDEDGVNDAGEQAGQQPSALPLPPDADRISFTNSYRAYEMRERSTGSFSIIMNDLPTLSQITTSLSNLLSL